MKVVFLTVIKYFYEFAFGKIIELLKQYMDQRSKEKEEKEKEKEKGKAK